MTRLRGAVRTENRAAGQRLALIGEIVVMWLRQAGKREMGAPPVFSLVYRLRQRRRPVSRREAGWWSSPWWWAYTWWSAGWSR